MIGRALRVAVLIATVGGNYIFATAGHAADTPQSSPDEVTLTINPDGSASWNGEPLANEPALKDKLAHRTQQMPRLELDLQFHAVGELSDSNRQTLMDIVALAARFGYVHVENTGDGAKLTVLGPSAAAQVPK